MHCPISPLVGDVNAMDMHRGVLKMLREHWNVNVNTTLRDETVKSASRSILIGHGHEELFRMQTNVKVSR